MPILAIFDERGEEGYLPEAGRSNGEGYPRERDRQDSRRALA